MFKFKPPASILKTVQQKQNTDTIKYKTEKAAEEMYNKDPVVKHNIENFTNSRTNGLLPKENIHVEQPFEPIVGHTGLNIFPEHESDMFQRKMEMFTGGEKTKFFKQKEAVLNDPNLMAPDPILNTAVPNAENRIQFFKQNLLRQGNVKPFESELVGARHIQPIFRPLPKVGGDKYVNPKKTLEYQTLTPPKSNVEKGTLAAKTFKNKVETAFAMDRLGFTTTGAIIAPAQYGTEIMKEQNRPETSPTGESIFRNTAPFNSTALQQQSPANFNVNTSKESVQKNYIPNPDAFNSQPLHQKSPANFNVNTSKESVQKNYIPNPDAFNSQPLHQQSPANFSVNTSKESVQKNYIPNPDAFNSQPLHQQSPANFNVNTSKENVQKKYIPNPDAFNSQPLHQQSPANFNVNTSKELVQKKYIPNPDAFNSQPLHQKSPTNFNVNTNKEFVQKKYIPNPDAFNSQPLHQKSPANFNVNTSKEFVQKVYIPNPDAFNGQPAQQQSPANFNINTNKESIQKKYIPNPDAFNSQTAHQKAADNYNVNTNKESVQKKYIPNPDAFNGQPAQQKAAENYNVNTEKEQVMNTRRTGNGTPYNNVEAQSTGIGDIKLINKEDILRGRMVNKRGPSITNVDVNVGFNKRKQIETRGFLNGYAPTSERLHSIYNIKNKEIDITERLDPCLNIPLSENPYRNAFL
jgi:hypothetical protein